MRITDPIQPVAGWPALWVIMLMSWCVSCSPRMTHTTVHSTTIARVRQTEQWIPGQGVDKISATFESNEYVVHVAATRVCRVHEVEQKLLREQWETGPQTGSLVAELVMMGTGLGITASAWATQKDNCGSSDLLASCHSAAHGYALAGLGLAAAGAAALVIDSATADKGEQTRVELGRAIPPHRAPCQRPTYAGSVAHLLAPNVTLSGIVDQQGNIRIRVPDNVWNERFALDFDLLIDGQVLGRVVLHREATCDDC